MFVSVGEKSEEREGAREGGREAPEVTQWSEGASTLKALWQQI